MLWGSINVERVKAEYLRSEFDRDGTDDQYRVSDSVLVSLSGRSVLIEKHDRPETGWTFHNEADARLAMDMIRAVQDLSWTPGY